MTDPANSRRQFLKTGASTAAASVLAGGIAAAQQSAPSAPQPDQHPALSPAREVQDDYSGFFRFKPSRGNDPDSPFYLGKLVPGFRAASAGPAPFVAPDLDKLPYELKNGVK